MPFQIAEWFGYDVAYRGPDAARARENNLCPFANAVCAKTFNDRTISGACSACVGKRAGSPPVVICPNRLYAEGYLVLQRVADIAFGGQHDVVFPHQLRDLRADRRYVVALGKNYGGEIRLPSRGGRGAYFVDWILARVLPSGELAEFAAVEVQAIDTTGRYKPEVEALRAGAMAIPNSRAGLNWENVNKRILPQLIYKGHVLRRENLCRSGLFFISPSQVHERIMSRLGGNLLSYPNLQPGCVTFLHFGLGSVHEGQRHLSLDGRFTTTIDQVALAFTAPTNLPEPGVYERAIRVALGQIR